MKITTDFLQEVQRAGWLPVEIGAEAMTVSCPNQGCNVRLKLAPQMAIPNPCEAKSILPEVKYRTWDDVRLGLLNRREKLGLSIREVEMVAGLADDHLAKMETDKKIPNAETLNMWANALGYELVFRPMPFGKMMLRVIAESRHRLGWRRKMQPHHHLQRKERGASDGQ